jgi:large subunit ribosomal protein L29
MSDLNLADIRNGSDQELLDLISDKRIELFNLRFQQASGQLENTNLLRYAKRDLARLLTIKRERELGGSNG